ncbi:hypothetical protein PRIPAC_79990, partial [Pristionchus pacificus]|uniref:Uncharacterized protein n=1 Tax=Pristionchus pacificus TaxID=54126 RepID=A0A2A6BHQ3_PRIPA
MESSKMEPKSGAARNEKKDGEPQAPATALKKAEEQVVVGGEGGGMEDVAVVSVEEEEEAALLATGIQNDHPDGLMGWWRDNSAESVRDLHMVLGGESDLSRGVVGRVWEEMEEAQGMGGRVAVHVSGHVAGDSLGFTLSFGPDKLPITSSILVDLRRLFVTLRTVRHDRTSGDEWSVGDDDVYVDDGHKFALKLLNASKELPQIKLPPIHAVRDASRPLIPGQSAVSILKDEEWKVLNNGGVRPYPPIDSYGPPGEDEENDEEERANLDNLRPDWIGEVAVELEDSRPFATPPSRNSRSTLYKTALEAPSDVSARPDNDAVATSLLAALDQSIPHDDDVIISTPPLPPFDDSMDALPRHKRRYER